MSDIKFWHRIKLPDGSYTPGTIIHGPDGGDWPTTRFGIPEDLTGKYVLDVGTASGFFAFEAEKRGAIQVLATDVDDLASEGFFYCRKLLGSHVTWGILDVQSDLQDTSFIFDLVMCFGVLYHIKSPLTALENLFSWTKINGTCLIETAVSTHNEYPMLEYIPGCDNDPTNYFYPNHMWMELAAKNVGFHKFEQIYQVYNRATYRLTK